MILNALGNSWRIRVSLEDEENVEDFQGSKESLRIVKVSGGYIKDLEDPRQNGKTTEDLEDRVGHQKR
jgi:hypothetical protein